MDRRGFIGSAMLGVAGLAGCRSQPTGEVMTGDRADMVGSTAAGAETYKPLIDEALGKLLARQNTGVQPAAAPAPAPKKICFVGLENRSSEDLGDFKEQIVEIIDTKINTSGTFQPLSRKIMAAGLMETRLQPNELLVPIKRRQFVAAMDQGGQSFDYLLFATITSGTTGGNNNKQKDYMLSLELVNIKTGSSDKESASLRKAYRSGH